MITTDIRGSIVSVAVLGEFSLGDFKEFEELVLHQIKFEGPVDLAFDLREMADFTVDMAWEEIKFSRQHGGDFRRIAVLTDSQWVAWSAWLEQLFVSADLRVFADADEAGAWLAEGDPGVSGLLVRADELMAHVGDPQWRIFDCRHDLQNVDYGANAYAKGHIPGALFLHLDRDLSGNKTGRNGRHPLPDPAAFAARMGECGVGPDTQVVAYDNEGGIFASRLWWMLRWIGHDKVALLDGGLPGWRRAKQALVTEVPAVAPVPCPLRTQALAVEVDFVLSRLKAPESLILDARAPERYSGEEETLDPVGGHIPGAVNRFYFDNLDDAGCYFKPADELRGEFVALLAGRDPAQVIQQCGSGVTACHNLLAMEIAGLAGSKLYPGSWSEWCADPARPIAVGEST